MKYSKLLFVPLAVFLQSCSDGPSVEDVAKEFAQSNTECPGIEVLDLKKVNGESGATENQYIIEVAYKVRISNVENICKEKPVNDMVRLAFLQIAERDGVPFENGVVLQTQEEKSMKRTENGWVFD